MEDGASGATHRANDSGIVASGAGLTSMMQMRLGKCPKLFGHCHVDAEAVAAVRAIPAELLAEEHHADLAAVALTGTQPHRTGLANSAPTTSQTASSTHTAASPKLPARHGVPCCRLDGSREGWLQALAACLPHRAGRSWLNRHAD